MPPKTATKSAAKSASKSTKGHPIIVGKVNDKGEVEPFSEDEDENYVRPPKVSEILTQEEEREFWRMMDGLFTTTAEEARSRLEASKERKNEHDFFPMFRWWFKTHVYDGERTLTQALEQAAKHKAINESGMRSEHRRSPTTFGFLGFKQYSNGELMKDPDGKLIPYWQDREEGEEGISLSKLLMMRKSGKKGGISKSKRISVIKRRKSKKNKRRYTRKNYPGE